MSALAELEIARERARRRAAEHIERAVERVSQTRSTATGSERTPIHRTEGRS